MSDGGTWTPGGAPGATQPPVPPEQQAGQQQYAPRQYAPQQYGRPGYGPAPSGQPGYPPFGQPVYRPVPTPGRDGFAIAALVLGLVGGALLAIVFGIVALTRIRSSGRKGRGMAITGIVLGSVVLVGGVVAAVAIPVALSQHNRALHEQCAAGDMEACNRLFEAAPDGSDEQAWADTCGGRTQGGTLCTEVSGVFTYGDDSELDTLWDACGAGDMGSCDLLYDSSEPGSDYEWFGGTCGNRTDGTTECAVGNQDT